MSSPLAVLKLVLSKIPLMISTAVSHVLGLSPTSQKWDLRTAITVNLLREILGNSHESTVTQQQQRSLRDPGVKGNLWVSRVSLPVPPEDVLRDALSQAIRALGTGGEEYSLPALETVTAEWTGHRGNVPASEPEPSISEADKYRHLTEETTSNTTVIYFHGGSYYLMDPCSTRGLVSDYARLTGGRVLNVRYRLAPQNPFPAALLDALVVYLSLLYPPEGSLHDPVPASDIVIGGDSSGGNLAAVLLQLLLQIHRSASGGELPTIMFHGRPVEVPLPAGLALSSASIDLTGSLRSSELHGLYDYLPGLPVVPPNPPPCGVWPTDPPRAHFFCEDSAMCHPFVSPLAASSWEGSPPIFVICGQERVADENKVLAQTAAAQGVPIVWEQYEAMPHCFSQLFAGTAVARKACDSWAGFVKKVTEDAAGIGTKGSYIVAKSLDTRRVDVSKLLDVSPEEVMEGMRQARDEFVRRAASDCQ